jgi:cation transport regulator ChaB
MPPRRRSSRGSSPDSSREDLPSTLKRSDKHAQAIYQETHDSAAEQYGDGERAHRTAFSALKHSYEKVGDRWEPKDEKGPSDKQAAQRGNAARNRPRSTAEGVDANASKEHLLEVARRLDIRGRSRMRKGELVDAIMKANRRESRRALDN